MEDANTADIDVEILGANLSQTRLRPLANRGSTGTNFDSAVDLDGDARRFRRPDGAAFNEAGDSEPVRTPVGYLSLSAISVC